MAANDPDFADYMARQAAAATEAAERAEKIARHQVWKETTWAGWLSTKFLELGDLPFIQAVIEALRDQKEGKSVPALLLTNFARLAIVFAAIVAVYILGKLIQLIIGKEIVIHEEVVVIEEITRSQAEQEEKAKGTTKRRSARDKKKD